MLTNTIGWIFRAESTAGRNVCSKLCQHDKVGQLRRNATFKPLEIIARHKGAGKLTCVVRAEVKEDDAVAILNTAIGTIDFGGFNKLIVFIASIGIGQCLAGAVGIEFCLAGGHYVIACLNALPAVIAVHREEATNYRSDLTIT